jgi:tetratricopeptide (TPR) repeat protein
MYRCACSLSTCTVIVVAIVGAVVGVARAQDEQAVERAVVLFETAEERYRDGRFDVAVQLLLEARALTDEPTISYNLGRAYEELAELGEAIEAYRHYLERAPGASDRDAVTARIAALEERERERERAALERAEAERARAALEARERESALSEAREGASRPSAGPIVVTSVGALGVGAGVVFGVLSMDRRSEAVDDPVHQTARQAFRDAETFATGANIAFVAGGVVAAIGITWLVIELVSGDDPSGAPVSIGIGPGSLVLHGELR